MRKLTYFNLLNGNSESLTSAEWGHQFTVWQSSFGFGEDDVSPTAVCFVLIDSFDRKRNSEDDYLKWVYEFSGKCDHYRSVLHQNPKYELRYGCLNVYESKTNFRQFAQFMRDEIPESWNQKEEDKSDLVNNMYQFWVKPNCLIETVVGGNIILAAEINEDMFELGCNIHTILEEEDENI